MVRVVGLMSGTSVDGVDAALVDIQGTETDLSVDLLATATYAYPAPLQKQILAVCAGQCLSVADMAALDDAIARAFAQAAQAIQAGHASAELIGSHGQTVYHQPPDLDRNGNIKTLGYSLQLGRGEVIARETGLLTASNFRRADLAAGGQGAPLAPKIHACLLSEPTLYRCVQNIGGMGNVTFLPPLAPAAPLGADIPGWDTGPGNVLIDLAIQQFSKGEQRYDCNGERAAKGNPCQALVQQWLDHPFFQEGPPKSTGRELFGPEYLQQRLQAAKHHDLSEDDILATLTEFTAASIADSYQRFLPQMPDQVLLCGGGSHNRYLRQRLDHCLGGIPVMTTSDFGVDTDSMEAIAFAILAHWRVLEIPGNLPAVTGAQRPVVLGDLHVP